MAKNQESVTLDEYHRFVVEQFEGIAGRSKSDVIAYMVRSWVSDHPRQVEQAEASISDYRRAQRGKG